MKKKQIAVLLSAAMLTGTVLAPGQTNTAAAATAAKIRTNKTKVTVAAGKTVAVTVKNTGSKKIKATVSDKKIATAKVVKKKIKIAGKKAGKTKVTLTAKGMKKCEVNVTVKGQTVNTVVTNTPAATKQPATSPAAKPQASAGAGNLPVVSGQPASTSNPKENTLKIWQKLLDDGVIVVKNGVLTDGWEDVPSELVIPDGAVTSIGEGAFMDCDNLTKITIPDSVTSIGDQAFYCCSKLKSVVLPDSVTSIGDETFYWCFNLKSVVLPGNLKSIGEYAFSDTAIELSLIHI